MQKFLVDGMFGNLARFLRLIGFDSLYYTDKKDDELIEISLKENRIILTRDYALSNIKHIKSIYIESIDLKNQIKQIIKYLKLKIYKKNFFTICLECNTQLKKIEKTEIKGKIPQQSYETFNDFQMCPNCHRIYWKGSHYQRLLKKIETILDNQTLC